ncbi:hypothetical protein OEA41_006605 [Lepraria neglecta]|uniref:Uncharacterized protein n=1 Tax=Lepraria neglecta TaxID=209136 RepID=A0AAE0DKR7_9LECA|nr:hypothetical protein OEA41_006605 [Lepraria neglecta]
MTSWTDNDSLWCAFDYLMADEVTNAETDDAMTMNNMIGFRRLVREARTWKNREALESKRPITEWAHEDLQIQRLREQDYWAFRERTGAKAQDEVTFVRDLQENLGV